MATSGTVGATTISCREIFDHAFRRMRLLPEQAGGQHIATAQKLLWMILSGLNQRGISLWVIDTQLVGLTEGLANIATTAGNLALLNCNLRQVTRISGTASSSSGNSGNAYDQNLSTLCTQFAPNGNIRITFDTPSALTQVGFLPAVTAAWSYSLQWTVDGVTWTTFQIVTNKAVIAGQWQWYDVDAVLLASGFRILATGGTTLNVYEVMCGNNPSDIPMAPMDRDTWTQLPNKTFLGRPTMYNWDRRVATPIMHIWPAPSDAYVLTFLIVSYVQRQLQDVGTLAQQIELPDRWYLAVIAELTRNLAREVKECDPNLFPDLDADAERLLRQAWDGESDGMPVKWIPNIGVYTA